MNEKKDLTCEVELTPQVKRTQKIAWVTLLLGLIVSAISTDLLFMEPLMILVAFICLRKVASSQVMKLCCKRMIWVQALLAATLLIIRLMWIDLGGDMLVADLAVIVMWLASAWCYGTMAQSGTLSKESIGWVNVIVTLVVVRSLSISFGDDDFVEAFSALYFGLVFIMAYAWYKLIHSEAFSGKESETTDVAPKKASGLVNKYTILGFVPVVVLLVITLSYM